MKAPHGACHCEGSFSASWNPLQQHSSHVSCSTISSTGLPLSQLHSECKFSQHRVPTAWRTGSQQGNAIGAVNCNSWRFSWACSPCSATSHCRTMPCSAPVLNTWVLNTRCRPAWRVLCMPCVQQQLSTKPTATEACGRPSDITNQQELLLLLVIMISKPTPTIAACCCECHRNGNECCGMAPYVSQIASLNTCKTGHGQPSKLH